MNQPDPATSPWQSPVSVGQLVISKVAGDPVEYQRVRIGLKTIYYAVGLGVLVVILMFVNGAIQDSSDAGANLWMGMGTAVLVFVCLLTWLVGLVLCCFAPRANERTMIGLALASLIFNVLTVLIGATGVVPAGIEAVLGLFGIVLNFLPILFFCLFCKTVGKNIQSPALISKSGSALVWYIATCAMMIGLIVVTIASAWGIMSGNPSDARQMAGFFAFMGILGLIFLVVFFVWIFRFIRMLTEGIAALTVTDGTVTG